MADVWRVEIRRSEDLAPVANLQFLNSERIPIDAAYDSGVYTLSAQAARYIIEVPPGTYQIEVRACIDDDCSEAADVTVNVDGPFDQ